MHTIDIYRTAERGAGTRASAPPPEAFTPGPAADLYPRETKQASGDTARAACATLRDRPDHRHVAGDTHKDVHPPLVPPIRRACAASIRAHRRIPPLRK